MELGTFKAHIEGELRAAFELSQLAVDNDGDWQFSTKNGPVWVRVLGDPDLHVQVFARIAVGVLEDSWPEINRLNSIMTAGALLLTEESTIVASMRLHRSMANRESLQLVVNAMSSYIRELGPMFEIVHGGGPPLPGPMFEIVHGGGPPLPGPTTPEHIETLVDGHIFVFGSNASGQHGGGAARVAHQRFGAQMGLGEGLAGQSYALPTMEGPQAFQAAAERFVQFAGEHPELTFWLTRVGCGIAGYAEEDVRGWFADAPENVVRPEGW